MKVVVSLHIPVICYGIRTDFLTNGFAGSRRLLEIAHTIEELKTICDCGKKAIYNARFIGDRLAVVGETVVIDNHTDIYYRAMCANCYYEERDKTILK